MFPRCCSKHRPRWKKWGKKWGGERKNPLPSQVETQGNDLTLQTPSCGLDFKHDWFLKVWDLRDYSCLKWNHVSGSAGLHLPKFWVWNGHFWLYLVVNTEIILSTMARAWAAPHTSQIPVVIRDYLLKMRGKWVFELCCSHPRLLPAPLGSPKTHFLGFCFSQGAETKFHRILFTSPWRVFLQTLPFCHFWRWWLWGCFEAGITIPGGTENEFPLPAQMCWEGGGCWHLAENKAPPNPQLLKTPSVWSRRVSCSFLNPCLAQNCLFFIFIPV